MYDDLGDGDVLGTHDPMAEWARVTTRTDLRLFPKKLGGRRLRHPFLPPIIYPQNPDRTLNFGYDVLRKTKSVLVKTIDSSAAAFYQDAKEDVVVREIWSADKLGPETRFFHQLHRYWMTALPAGRYIGWQPRDLSPKNYFIRILNVECGPTDEFSIEELGDLRPWLLRETLILSFARVNEAASPGGALTFLGR